MINMKCGKCSNTIKLKEIKVFLVERKERIKALDDKRTKRIQKWMQKNRGDTLWSISIFKNIPVPKKVSAKFHPVMIYGKKYVKHSEMKRIFALKSTIKQCPWIKNNYLLKISEIV